MFGPCQGPHPCRVLVSEPPPITKTASVCISLFLLGGFPCNFHPGRIHPFAFILSFHIKGIHSCYITSFPIFEKLIAFSTVPSLPKLRISFGMSLNLLPGHFF